MISRSTRFAKAPTLEQLQTQSDAGYDAVRASNATLSPQSSNDLANSIEGAFGPRVATRKLNPKAAIAADALAGDMRSAPMSIADVDEARQWIGRNVAGSVEKGERAIGMGMKQTIDDHLDALTPADVTGTNRAAEVVDTLKDAREKASRVHKSQLFEAEDTGLVAKGLRRAATSGTGGNEINAIRQNVRRVLENPKLRRGYNADELQAIPRGKLKAKQLGKVRKRPTFWKELCDVNPEIDRRDWSPMWQAIMAVKNPLRRTAWVVMFFTGIRSDDVRSLRWDQIDLTRKTIRLDDMKNGETRTLPICDTVVAALSAIRSNYAFVFPTTSTKTGETIYIDHLDTLMHPTMKAETGEVDGDGGPILKSVPVLRQHDTRHHFTSACGPARVPSYAAAFLRGDITSDNRDDDMVMEYQEDLDLHDLVADIEKVIIERINATPCFEVVEND